MSKKKSNTYTAKLKEKQPMKQEDLPVEETLPTTSSLNYENLNDGQKRALKRLIEKTECQPPVVKKVDEETCRIVFDFNDREEELIVLGKLMEAFGTANIGVSYSLMTQLVNALSPDGLADTKVCNNALAMAYNIRPRDEIEGMLISQMIATHQLSMDNLRQAGKSEMPSESRSMFTNSSTKLSRTYIAQMEALQRYRGKGEQKMTVEHVHINAGGQAIIGNVKTPSK